jgi:hypothetical protein
MPIWLRQSMIMPPICFCLDHKNDPQQALNVLSCPHLRSQVSGEVGRQLAFRKACFGRDVSV